MIASKGRMLTGSSSFALAISTHSPSRSSPVVRSDGRMFPVEVVYRPTTARVAEAVAGAVMAGLAEDEGDVLAFLPGAREIREKRR